MKSNASQSSPSAGARPVALLEWNRGGHHEGYLVLFARALLELGHPVRVLCRDKEAFLARLGGAEVYRDADRLLVAEIPGEEWIRARRRWPASWVHWAWARKVDGARRSLGGGEPYVACLYEHQTRMVCALADRWRGRAEWSGLYLHAHAFHHPSRLAPGVKRRWPVTRALRDRGLRGLLMLDEGMAPRVGRELGIPVLVAPDPADATRGGGGALAAEARASAGRRPVVGVFGHLLPSKGVATLARCAMDPGAGETAFWFVGAIHWPMFDAEEAGLLKRLAAGERGNVWLHDARIPDEATYNELVDACDVLFAAYRDFPHSSNTLAKAAIFEKPVIVSEGHLMANRVREFRLGVVVPQDDATASLAAIRRLCADPAGWAAETKPRWREYRELHSPERLRSVLGDFFGARKSAPDQR